MKTDERHPELLSQVWGREVERVGYAGHDGLVLNPHPSSLGAFLTGVERFADREYLVQGDQRVTVGGFFGALGPGSHLLKARGVNAGDNVMLIGYNSPAWVVALWSIWAVGAVPILGNRWWSENEIAHAVELTKPTAVITDLPESSGSAFDGPLALDEFVIGSAATHSEIRDFRASLPAPPEDSPALVIFTSGSSGAPKGVLLSHRSVIANQHNLLMRSGRLPTDDDDGAAQASVTLVCTPLFHIGGISNLLTNLVSGGKLVLNKGRFDSAQVLDLIEAEKVQSFGGVPTMAIRVLEDPAFETKNLSSLRSWPLGGAPLPARLLALMQQKVPQLAKRGLGNTWGMSESGGFLTVAGNRALEERPGTVGKPYPVVEIKIDTDEEGATGEILVRSPTVMLGYLGIEGAVTEDGWLQTGDLGHLDADGYLFLDGRSKDIVIRGGENISCAHVEITLAEHESVVEVAVFGTPHADLGEEVAAVVVYRGEQPPDPADLTAFLKGKLAYFEVPTRWQIQRDRLPTLAGEKIDKKTLRTAFADTPADTK
jgi:acyl-CoA synthetase (AMP-forming)/AMP-acid ligase II